MNTDRLSMVGLSSFADETGSPGLRTALAIGGKFVRDKISDGWPSQTVGDGRDVQKEPRATALRLNEAEASVVLPFANSPLEAHAFPCALTFRFCRAEGSAER